MVLVARNEGLDLRIKIKDLGRCEGVSRAIGSALELTINALTAPALGRSLEGTRGRTLE